MAINDHFDKKYSIQKGVAFYILHSPPLDPPNATKIPYGLLLTKSGTVDFSLLLTV